MKGHKFPTPNIQRVYNYFVVAAISHKCALSVSLYLDRRANKATERARTGHQQKLTRLLWRKEQRRSKPDDNCPLDKNETRVLSYGPKLYGLPKLHKPGFPMRPIVSFCGSPTYQLSKYLTTILQPLTDKSRRKLQSTEDFINATKTVQIPDDYKLVSFDVKSLFTSIPLQLALQCTETAILQSTDPLPLPTEDIMDLLNLCLTSTYFQYNGKHYR